MARPMARSMARSKTGEFTENRRHSFRSFAIYSGRVRLAPTVRARTSPGEKLLHRCALAVKRSLRRILLLFLASQQSSGERKVSTS